ncbi:MAG: polysaccharide biosynthesis C-terminal domain-containing protein [Planctomycetota bacterium]|nr:polysaccharide biosynthesis C-terminal domain-containing protein [Planctomycetota bacterium]
MTSVHRTLTTLGLGLFAQRAAQLIALLMITRSLGAEFTGKTAQGLALAGLLSVLASAGLRNEVARGLAQSKNSAGLWLRSAVKARLLRCCYLWTIAIALAFAASDTPWFWIVSATACIPNAFDLKQIGDVAARTRSEVVIETSAALLFLLTVLIWLQAGGCEPVMLAGIQLGCRVLYALGSAFTIRKLPAHGTAPKARELLRKSRRLAPAQVFSELPVAADVCIVGLLAGDSVAGLYTIGSRIAGAAGMPTVQLTRLFFAHQIHAATRGRSARATRVAMRATTLVMLPLLAGGWIAADQLCALFGSEFANAADATRWLLVAITAQHIAWQVHQALLATGRDEAYRRALWLPAMVHTIGLLTLTKTFGSTGAALATALAQICFLTASLLQLDRAELRPLLWLRGPLMLAFATGAVTLLTTAIEGGHALLWQLPMGGMTWCIGIYLLELRNRWSRIGTGLIEASDFHF